MNKKIIILLLGSFFVLSLMFLSASVSAQTWVNLDGKKAELAASDSSSLDGFKQATWSIWVKQNEYNTNAGLIGKYAAVSGGRSYLIRTSLVNGISVVISNDGTNIGSYSSSISRQCGIRNNNEWTMITVVYTGTQLKYYRNGAYCDTDSTPLRNLADSSPPLRVGGGNNVFFNGSVDDVNVYSRALSSDQIRRLYDESVHGRNRGQSIPVLVYHRVETPAQELIKVTPTNFKQQMAYLDSNDFNAVTTTDYNNWKKGTFNMPERAVIVYFDDGWQSVYTTAKPVMDQYGFDGSMAVVTNYADQNSGPTYMSWNQLKTLATSGWAMVSHGVSHAHMLKLSKTDFISQLQNAKSKITQQIGTAPESFVFPFHEANSTYTQICGQYYDLCWTQGSMNPSYDYKSTNGKVYLSLRRINIVNNTNMNQFMDLLGRDTHKAGEWFLKEGSGTIISDNSGNSNTLSLLNGAIWNSAISPASRSGVPSEEIIPLDQNEEKEKKTKPKSKNPKLDRPEHINDDLGGNIIHTDKAKDKGKKKASEDEAESKFSDNMPIEKDSDFPEYQEDKNKK